MKGKNYQTNYLSGIKSYVLFTVLNLISCLSLAQVIPCNTSSPWVNGTYTNLSAQIDDDVPSVIPLCLGSVSNISNLTDANLDNFSTISITGVNCNATIGVKDNDVADTYPAGAWAGFRVGAAGLLSGSVASSVTITTWNNGVLRETYNAVTNVIGINSSLLNNDGTANIGFVTAQDFDEIRIQYQALVGVLYTAQVYHAVVERYCAGPAVLPCNQVRRLSGSTYPAVIESARTGTTGVTLGNIRNTENVVSNSDTDYASIILPVGILATGSISVHDMITDYPAGNFAGFVVENNSLLGVGILNNTTIRTYLNGSLQETHSGGALLLSAPLLADTSRQTIGFITTLPYDEIQFTINQTLALNLDTTRVYSAVMKRHCASLPLFCNTPAIMVEPVYPVNINANHTGITGVACAGCTISGASGVIDLDPATYATISLTAGVAVQGSLSVKQEVTDFPANTFAGFLLANVNLLGVNILSNVTITTYLNGVQAESKSGAVDLLSLAPDIVTGPEAQLAGFVTTMPFDEVQLTMNQTVGVNLGQTLVFGTVLQRLCAAPVNLPCNITTRFSGGQFPAVVEASHTGTTGITLGSVRNTGNAVSESDTDFASIILPVGILATGSISVRDALADYPAGNFAGFDIENASLLGIGLLNYSTIRTYLNGTLQETKTGNALLVSATVLSDTARQTVGFVTTMPYDEIQYTVNQPLGLSLDTTKIYGAVMKKHCAGPALTCNTPVILSEPAYPVNINGDHTGISGVLCGNCNIYNTSKITDAIDTTYATISFTAAIAVNGSVAVKDEIETYPSGTFAGFKIENNNILGAGVLNHISVTTYLDGVLAETQTGNTLLISANADTLCLAGNSGPQKVGFVTAMPFNEVQLTMHQPVGVTLGITKVYGAVLQKFCAGPPISNNSTYWLANAEFPVIIENFNTGISGLACVGCGVQNAENVIDEADSTYATIKVTAGAGADGSVSVHDVLSVFPSGSFAGYAIRDMNNLLQTNLFKAVTVSTYLDGVMQESKTDSNLLSITPVISLLDTALTGVYNVGFNTTASYDEIRLTVGNLAALLNEVRVYGAFVDTKIPGTKTEPDIAVTYINLSVTGDVNRNDIVSAGTTYGLPLAHLGNPDICVPSMAADGTYSFICSTPGEYNFSVPVCPAGLLAGCPGELLTITVLNTSVLTNAPTAHPDVASTMEGTPVNINVLSNDRCNNGLNCLLSNPAIVMNPSNGAVIINVNGTLTYTAAPGFTGKDSILYSVCDNQVPAKCDSEYVFVTVLPAGNQNTTDASDDYAITLENTVVTGNVLANDTDPENNLQSVTPQNIINAAGTYVLDADGMYTFTPADGFTGPVSFPYVVCDNGTPSVCDNATLHILVRQAPDLTPSVTVTPNIMHGVTTFNVTVRVSELNDVITEGAVTVRIPKDNRLSFTYNPADAFIGIVPVMNNAWSYDNSNPFFHIFTCNSAIQGAGFSAFGFVATFNPLNSSGVYPITTTVVSGSGSEVKTNNNTDAESIDYFNN